MVYFHINSVLEPLCSGQKNGNKSPASLRLSTYRCYLPVLAGLGGSQQHRICSRQKAERGGFEPPKAFDLTRLPIVHLRPLGHLSNAVQTITENPFILQVALWSSTLLPGFLAFRKENLGLLDKVPCKRIQGSTLRRNLLNIINYRLDSCKIL